MKSNFFSGILTAACLLFGSNAVAAFKDVKIDLTGGNLLTESEIGGSAINFGVTVADDGTVNRVEATDASAVLVMSGKFHSTDHGWGNFSSTVTVDGPVKISMGTCAWGGDVKIVDASGSEVGKFNTNTGECYHGDKVKNIASTIYKGDATTLTISGGSYTPYFAVEAVDPSEIKDDAKVTFSLGEFTDAGETLPAPETVEIGKTFTIPANHTLYLDGKTLVGWTDGSKNYEIGDIVTVEGDMELTPRFVDNTVSLADRTEPVTITWNFRRDQGAPAVGWEGKEDCFWVAQAKIGTEIIDVKLPFSTKPGKFNNKSHTDWVQINQGTLFQVPSCKGAEIAYESYSPTEKTTIDGVIVPANGSTNPSFKVASTTETVPLDVQDGSYYRYVRTTLPVVDAPAGDKFENAEATLHWDFTMPNADKEEKPVVTPENAFSMTPFSVSEGIAYSGPQAAVEPDETYLRFLVTSSGHLEWRVVPKKGVKFTPTRVTAKVRRFGTDGGLIDVVVRNDEGVTETLETGLKPRREKTLAEDKHKDNPKICSSFDLEVPATLATEKGFMLDLNVYDLSNKNIGVSDINIYGFVDGVATEVNVYTLSIAANPEEAGKVTVYPSGTEFDEGTEVTLTASKNFGYKFTNWTDASKKVVSEDAKFNYTVNADAALTANFEKLDTYELVYSVEGGANLYQVQPTPAPNVVDGKNMYEAGTKVTLTATSNPIMTFTNWSDGQSSTEISFDMTEDKEFTAFFSASDFLAGWDFYRTGSNGRVADFASADNDAANLVLRNAEGSTSGWLDKSHAADPNGYEGRNAAVNWRTTGLGDYYWQTTLNAEAFTDIHVTGGMLYNYNAHTKYYVEVSTDGENWEKGGEIALEGAKNWKDYDFTLPAKYNNQKTLYIRWIADKESPVDGTESQNDGISMSGTYITGTAKLFDDGTAPVLVDFVPEEGSNNASINGRIVLTFDEKVKMADDAKAILHGANQSELTPEVTGKTIIFKYRNLSYGTSYKFELPTNSVMDLTDNKLDKAVVINFTTKTRPTVEKATLDFIVPMNGSFKDAIEAANNRENKDKRFIIFVRKGYYELPYSETETITKDGVTLPSPITYLTASNVSIIGEDRDATIITNLVKDPTEPGMPYPIEGLHNVTTLFISKGVNNTYIQDITFKNGLNDNTGRGEAVEDNGNKTIYKNVTLWGFQDTYCSNNQNGRSYFEGGVLRGCTDFLCGKGDVYYKDVTLQMCTKDGKGSGYLAVPSTPNRYGYIFKDCEIVGETEDINGNYTLGRPWGDGTPIAVFIDTKMTAQPSAIGWAEMGTGWPKRFAEYNSVTATGSVIDLSGRKTVFGNNHANNPVLTAEEAEYYSYENAMGGTDNWDPATIAEAAPSPTDVTLDDLTISWTGNDYSRFYVVTENDKFVALTMETSIKLFGVDPTAVYGVRSANEMGGLSEPTYLSTSAIDDVVSDSESEVVSTIYYNVQGIRVTSEAKGILIKVDTLANGSTITTKIVR